MHPRIIFENSKHPYFFTLGFQEKYLMIIVIIGARAAWRTCNLAGSLWIQFSSSASTLCSMTYGPAHGRIGHIGHEASEYCGGF